MTGCILNEIHIKTPLSIISNGIILRGVWYVNGLKKECVGAFLSYSKAFGVDYKNA